MLIDLKKVTLCSSAPRALPASPFLKHMAEFLEQRLFGSEARREHRLTIPELSVVKACLKKGKVLSKREAGVLEKLVSSLSLFRGLDSTLRRVTLQVCEHRDVRGGRRVGEALLGVGKKEFDTELLDMLGDEILETEDRRAYVLLAGEVLYSQKEASPLEKAKYRPISKVPPGSVFFSHPRHIRRALSAQAQVPKLKPSGDGGAELCEYEELCALARGSCQVLELDLARYEIAMRAAMETEVEARVQALALNPLFGQLRHDCLIALAFRANI